MACATNWALHTACFRLLRTHWNNSPAKCAGTFQVLQLDMRTTTWNGNGTVVCDCSVRKKQRSRDAERMYQRPTISKRKTYGAKQRTHYFLQHSRIPVRPGYWVRLSELAVSSSILVDASLILISPSTNRENLPLSATLRADMCTHDV